MKRTIMKRTVPNRPLRQATAGIVMLSLATPALAAWVVTPAAELGVRHEDNVRLSATNEESAIVSSATLQAELANITEISEVSALVGGSFDYYSNTDANLDDRDTQFAKLMAIRSAERLSFGIDGSFQREILLRSARMISDLPGGEGELPIDDTDLEGDVDQGSVNEQVRRTRIAVRPNVTYQFAENTSATLSYRYLSLDYKDLGQETGLQDSETHSVGVMLAQRFSERDSGHLTLNASRLEPDVGLETDFYEAIVGWNRRLTERSRFNIAVGGRRAESDFAERSGVLLRARYAQATERGELYAQAERSLYPSAYGEILETDRVTLGYGQRLSDRLSWSLSAEGFTTESSVSDDVFSRNRDYVQVVPELRWLLTPNWSVAGRYEYTWVDRESDPDTADNHTVGFSLIYSPQRAF